MGSWGPGLLSDDLAMDVLNDYKILKSKGQSDEEATEQIMELYKDSIDDYDEGPVFWFALAAYQIKKGNVVSIVKENALKHINSGENLEEWKGACKSNYYRRKKILSELKEKLSQV